MPQHHEEGGGLEQTVDRRGFEPPNGVGDPSDRRIRGSVRDFPCLRDVGISEEREPVAIDEELKYVLAFAVDEEASYSRAGGIESRAATSKVARAA